MAVFMFWGFKMLPRERWQIFAAVPLIKDETGNWKGLNLTYYGIISASAYSFSLSIMVILLGACNIPITVQMKYVLPILIVAIPSSRIVARIVEKKTGTFTVGGAVFTAIIILPWVVTVINCLSDIKIPVFCFFAAVSIAYAFGEGLGRLACVSFGCCYGKALSTSGGIVSRLFKRFHFVFQGKTKKIAYASHLDGKPVIPVQGITSVFYTFAAIVGTILFLHGYFKSAMLLTLVITQFWRVISEFFRADYRGQQNFSAYQIMALIGVFYMGIVSLVMPSDMTFQGVLHATDFIREKQFLNRGMAGSGLMTPDILIGLKLLWQPSVILFMELFWLITFLYTGRSTVTGSQISFHVVKEKI